MTTIIKKEPSKFDALIDDDFDYQAIDFGSYNHLNIQQALYKYPSLPLFPLIHHRQMNTLMIQESLYFNKTTDQNFRKIMNDSDLKFSEVFFYELPQAFIFV